jgi:prepilin-type N-terminal cleavage/methylation domain-containing protein/prepilin-type processing-associated H-X9-DG protein
MPATRRNESAFTLIEVLVSIGILGALLAILLPALERARHKAYVEKCASNLHQIGIALAIYENDNAGHGPRTTYDPAAALAVGTGGSAADPFTTGGPAANDVTAAVFLLARVEKLPAVLFICPYNDDTDFHADPAAIAGRSNFTDYKMNLAYSFADPYPSDSAVAAGYQWGSRVAPTFAVAADLNPGVDARSNVFSAQPNGPLSSYESANSLNHEKEGQNVLFGDGHVDYQRTPLCGTAGDNIFSSRSASGLTVYTGPADANDSVLLPDDD